MACCSSYCTLDRYDNCSSKARVRTLDDIRDVSREQFLRARYQAKTIQLLRNRSTLLQYVIPDRYDEEEDYYQDDYDNYDNYNQEDLYNPLSETDNNIHTMNNWEGLDPIEPGPSPWYENTSGDDFWTESSRNDTLTPDSFPPSCSGSVTTSSSPYHTPQSFIDTDDIPAFFLDEPSNSSDNRNNKKTSNKSPKFKSLNKKITNTARIDIQATREQYQKITRLLNEYSVDQRAICDLMTQNWRLFIDVIQLPNSDLVQDAIGTLTNLISHNVLDSNTILNLLQHGLILALRQATWKYEGALTDIVTIIIQIAKCYKGAIPYMIELVVNSQLVSDLLEKFSLGETDYVRITVEFYYHLSEIIFQQLGQDSNAFQPLIPRILEATGVSERTRHIYSPLMAITTLLDPKVIETIISCCLTRAFSNHEDLVTMIYVILANALKVAHTMSMQQIPRSVEEELKEWSINIVRAFEENRPLDSLRSLCNSWRRSIRTAESSEHCSQGIGQEEVANRLLSLSGQFIDFYNQYYPPLASIWSEEIIRSSSSSPLTPPRTPVRRE